MNWNNTLTTRLKISYPLIQAPMLGVSTPEMVAAISNQGGLGSLPVGGLSPGATLQLIQKTKTRTNKPFAVNLFAHQLPAIHHQLAEEMQEYLEKNFGSMASNLKKEAIEPMRFYSYKEQVEILLSENIPIVSFTFGILDEETINAFQNKAVVMIGTATCLKEAEILEEKGIDMITAQGMEAGGHRGTFLEQEQLPLIGLMSLLPQVADHIKKPVLAAGGIADGRAIKASFILGASGVQIGSAFIASKESTAIPSYKTAIQHSSDRDSVLTRVFSGRWARGISNKFITTMEQSGLTIPEYPIQAGLTGYIRSYAQKEDNKELMPMWAGQHSSGAKTISCEEIFKQLIQQTESIL